MSALLVFAQLLRYRMTWLQALQLPAAIVAGLIALALGPFGFELLPFSLRENGIPLLSTYPSFLIAIVFACVGLGRPKGVTMTRRKLQDVGDTFFYSVACEVGQYAVAMLFGLFVLSPLFPPIRFGFTRTGLETFIDVSTIRRIGGTATDYLIGFGVASIAVTVVLEYTVPLTMLLFLGMAIKRRPLQDGFPLQSLYWQQIGQALLPAHDERLGRQ
jgi:Na+/glutamate symporter